MVVAQKLPLNVATIILFCIFSMLFSDFWARCPISIPTPPIAASNVHPLLVSRYSISSLWRYQCYFMHIISMLLSIKEAVSSGSWPIQYKILTLNVLICIALWHFRYFCFEHWDLGRKPNGTCPLFASAKCDAVWTSALSRRHSNFSMALFFIPIYRTPP